MSAVPAEMERLTGQRQPRRGLAPHICLQPSARRATRQAFDRLEHQHHRDHLAGHRRTAPTRREQLLEHPVREQTRTMLNQQRAHRTRRHQMPAHRRRVQKHTIRPSRARHAYIVPRPPTPCAETAANEAAVPSGGRTAITAQTQPIDLGLGHRYRVGSYAFDDEVYALIESACDLTTDNA